MCVRMKEAMDAAWTIWSFGTSVYDYFHSSAMEERIHTLEKVLIVHQFLIVFLIAWNILLMFWIIYISYIVYRNH